MINATRARRWRLLGLIGALPLAGCDWVVLKPSGDIARQQATLIVQSTLLMLLIIVPVIVLALWFAWKYRAANRDATYSPDWDHSVSLELVIWAAPLLIIIVLGALTWISTHTLDPYRALKRIDAERRVPATMEPLQVEVVALDWKWLFIYPEQGIAVMNELAAPVDRPIRFKLTSHSVMNSFFIPALAGQIYAMPGMETKLHAVMNRPGSYEGFSANYSGEGFSGMRFTFHGMAPADFDAWVAQAKAAPAALDRAAYLELSKPSHREPVRRYGQVQPDLYSLILDRCVEPGRPCMSRQMAADEYRQAVAAGSPELAGATLVCTADDPEGLGLRTAAATLRP